MIKYQKGTDNIVTLTMDMDGRSANVINHEIGKAFVPCLAHLVKEKAAGSLRGVIITSAKKTFLAGGDLDYLYHANDAQEVFAFAEQLKSLFRGFETLGVPVVAAINGAALGGGFELAMSCHYRIAIGREDVKIGLPEVTLGLLPGGGGCIKLMWKLGIEKAFPILAEGTQFAPKAALDMGLIDEIVAPEDLFERARVWIKHNPNPMQPWDVPNAQIPHGIPSSPQLASKIAALTAQLTHKTRNNYPAPMAIASVLVEGASVDFATAMRIESRYFTSTVLSPVCKNMVKAFWFDLNSIKQGASRPTGYGKSRLRKVGVIGAGMMGSGITYICALSGLEVVLKDVSVAHAEKGKDYARHILKKQIETGKQTPQAANDLLSKIKTTDSASQFDNCDIVIEAIFENRALKARVTREAEQYLDEYSIVASNTSTLPITDLAEASVRPSNFIGLHFFSPVERMPLVEIIKGKKTSAQTLAHAFDFVKILHKTPIVVNDGRGFYTSRVFMTYIMEAMAMLAEGQNANTIEQAGLQAGMPVAPLALTDELTLSLALDLEKQAATDLADAYIAHPAVAILQEMVTKLDRTGKAKGAGFYSYPEGEKKQLWADLHTHFALQTQLDITTMKDRLLFIQCLETVRCLAEGIVETVADANIGSIFGWGFAPFQGGTLQYINAYGLSNFVTRCEVLADLFGSRFAPPASLVERASRNEAF